jgi:hypothetical protein
MSAVKSTRPKSPRKIKVVARPCPSGGAPGELSITDGRGVTASYAYSVHPGEAAPATVVYLGRLGSSDVYRVVIDPAGGHDCDCPGFVHHGHCKHADGLAALLAREATRPAPRCSRCRGVGRVTFAARGVETNTRCPQCGGSGEAF